MTSKIENMLTEEPILNLRFEAMTRVVESLGAYESSQSATVRPISSTGFSNNSCHISPTNGLVHEMIHKKQSHVSNKCDDNDGFLADNCGNKRNCQGEITLQKRLSSAVSSAEQQRLRTATLLKYLYRNDNDVLGGSLIRIPAMQLENPDDESTTASRLMPDLDSTHLQENSMDQTDVDPMDDSTDTVPKMKASLLHMLVHHAQEVDSYNCERTNDIPPPCTKLEHEASINLGRLVSFTRTTVQHAPLTLLQSLGSSFSSLIQHRTKSWTILLLRHSLSSGDQSSRDRLMKLLAAQNDIEINAMQTEFVVQDQPLKMKSQLWAEGLQRRETRLEKLRDDSLVDVSHSVRHCDLLLPFTFKVSIDISFQGQKINVCLVAPGSAGAIFHERNHTITFLECTVDTDSLVRSMVEQARLVVLEAVARSTAYTGPVSNINPVEQPQTKSTTCSLNNLGGFHIGSAGLTQNITNESMGPPLPLYRNDLKKECSKEGHVLCTDPMQSSIHLHEGGFTTKDSKNLISSIDEHSSLLKQPGSFLIKKGLLKERSVQWGTGVKSSVSSNLQESKRVRQDGPIISRMVRSSKSFGRPGSDVFENARNATFSEFGHVSASISKHNPSRFSEKSPYHIDRNLLQRNTTSGTTEWNQSLNACNVALERTPTQLENLFLSSQLSQRNHDNK